PTAPATSLPATADRSAASPPVRPSLLALAARPVLGQLARDVIEHAVDERRRLLAAEPSRDLNRLVQGDGGGHLGPPEELERRQTKQAQVDARQARQAPVLRALGDERVDALAVLAHAFDQLAGEGDHLALRVGIEVLPEEREALRPHLVRPEQVGLVERLQG